ncbi:hypothetical protein HpNP102_07820 [Helicobacter pylori]
MIILNLFIKNKAVCLGFLVAKQESFGNFQKAAKLKEKLQKCKTIKANTRPASITKAEAIDARLNPKLSTAKDVANLSH